MPQYSLDSSFLIQADKGPYGMDFFPKFWEWIDEQIAEGIFVSPLAVHDELTEGDDQLAQWASDKKDNTGFFVPPSKEMQEVVTGISDYVLANYSGHWAEEFLEKADPWVIAHAKVDQLIVVTNEVAVGPDSKKPKIPNICVIHSVKCIDSVQFLRLLKPAFMSK